MMGLRQLVQKLDRIRPIIFTLQDKQNEVLFFGGGGVNSWFKVRTDNTNYFCTSRQSMSFNEAFGEKLFNFMLLNLRYFVLCHLTPLGSHAFVAMQSIMLEMGSVGQ